MYLSSHKLISFSNLSTLIPLIRLLVSSTLYTHHTVYIYIFCAWIVFTTDYLYLWNSFRKLFTLRKWNQFQQRSFVLLFWVCCWFFCSFVMFVQSFVYFVCNTFAEWDYDFVFVFCSSSVVYFLFLNALWFVLSCIHLSVIFFGCVEFAVVLWDNRSRVFRWILKNSRRK